MAGTGSDLSIVITAQNLAQKDLDAIRRSLGGLDQAVKGMGTSGEKAGQQMHGGFMRGSQGALALQGAMSGAGQGMLAMQVGMLGLGAAAGFMGAAVVKAGIDAGINFETAFAGVRKTVDATDAEFAQFNVGLRQMAKEMPTSREELARVAEAAGQLGIQKEALLGFTRTMADMGVATNMSSDQAATALARLANITSMPQSEFGRLGSTIVDLGNKFASTESEIVEMGLRLAGAGKTIGMTEPQILGFATALSSVGIEAEMGGSAFSRLMVNIGSAVSKGGDELDRFAKVAGMSAGQFADRFRTDAAGAIIAFIEGLGKMQKSGRDVFGTLEELGITEVRLRDAVLRSAGAAELMTNAQKVANEAWREGNALQIEAAKRYETTASKIEITKNTWTDLAVRGFQAYKPIIDEVLDQLRALAEEADQAEQFISKLGKRLSGEIPVGESYGDGLSDINTILTGLDRPLGAVNERLRDQGDVLTTLPDRLQAVADASLKLHVQQTALPDVLNRATESLRNEEQALKDAQERWRELDKTRSEIERNRSDTSAQRFRGVPDAFQANLDAPRREKEAIDAAAEASRKLKAEINEVADAERNARRAAIDLGDELLAVAGDAQKSISAISSRLSDDLRKLADDTRKSIERVVSDAGKARRALDTQEDLRNAVEGERSKLKAALDAKELVHRREVEDQEALRELGKDLTRAKDDDEKKSIRERFGWAQEDLAHRRALQDSEATWQRENIQKPLADLEKRLHDEELARQRERIIVERDEKIEAIRQEQKDRETELNSQAQKDIARAELVANESLAKLAANFFKKLPDAARGAIGELMAMLVDPSTKAEAIIAKAAEIGRAGTYTSGGGGSGGGAGSGGGGGGGGATRASDGQSLATQSAEVQATFQAVHGDRAAEVWTREHERELRGYARGGSFIVGRGTDTELVQFMATPGERVTVEPAGQSYRGAIDYDRLAAALARQPIIVQMDKREVARIVRQQLLQDKVGLTSLGLS